MNTSSHNSRSAEKPVVRAAIEEQFRNNLDLTIYGANAMARAILEVLRRHLIEGNTVELRGVGKIESLVKAARMHHVVNETKGNRMKMFPARRVLRFSPSQKLRAKMLEHYTAQQQHGRQQTDQGSKEL